MVNIVRTSPALKMLPTTGTDRGLKCKFALFMAHMGSVPSTSDAQQIACQPLLHQGLNGTPGATTHDKLLPSHHCPWCHCNRGPMEQADPTQHSQGGDCSLLQLTKTCSFHIHHTLTIMSGSNSSHTGQRASPVWSFRRSSGPEEKCTFHSRKLWVPRVFISRLPNRRKWLHLGQRVTHLEQGLQTSMMLAAMS